MRKQPPHLKNLLTDMIETITPQTEKAFYAYLKSTSVRDKALKVFEDHVYFLKTIVDTVDHPDGVDRVTNEFGFREQITGSLAELFFHQLAIVHDFREHIQVQLLDDFHHRI